MTLKWKYTLLRREHGLIKVNKHEVHESNTCDSSFTIVQFIPPANQVWGKVIFSEACVKNSVHRGVWSGGVPTPVGGLLPGGSGPGGVPGGDPPGRLLLRAVRILLECIVVLKSNLSTVAISFV